MGAIAMLSIIATGSGGNAYMWGDILIEAGVHIRDILRGADYRSPIACLITHEHGDHSCAAKAVSRKGYTERRPLHFLQRQVLSRGLATPSRYAGRMSL